ncbi:hypothetical protein SHKM778_47280 [Streptomyces sp. KM77-8]|uniref:Uncharacterized protein n=1 Tax=Streptomyces haneummycinicus TaxID=3074435 RepID=A0AAT9HLN5_9ACTN
MMLPRVERGLRFSLRWSTARVTPSPEMRSTWGRSFGEMNCRKKGEIPLRYRSCASAWIVSIAKDVFPLPLTPVKATILFLGMVTLTLRRLWVFAPTTSMNSSTRLPSAW